MIPLSFSFKIQAVLLLLAPFDRNTGDILQSVMPSKELIVLDLKNYY